MKRLLGPLLAVGIFAASLSLAAEPAGLLVGAAEVDITPAAGTPMGGHYRFRAVDGVIDPLYARAIVVAQDGSYAVLVSLDLATTSRELVTTARRLIKQQTGISGERVLISATHTHTGPQLPRGTLMDEITQVNSPAGRAFNAALPGKIAAAVSEAKARLAPARASAAVGKAEDISFNRRVIRQGVAEAIWQPKQINLAIEKPAGPVDPDVGVLVFDSAESGGKPIAAYLNFAMHPTSLGSGTKVSADYPGVFTRLIRERHGPDMIAAFCNGCCGNINQVDYFTGTRRGHVELGAALADAATESWPQLRPLATFAPRVRSELVRLERRRPTSTEIEHAKDVAARMMTDKLGTVMMAEAVRILDTAAKQDVPLEVEVQSIALADDLAVVALPGEIFVELGLAIKARSPFSQTIIAELANGSMGYVPNREAYPQGNYEVVSARAEAGSGEKLVETALRQLEELKAGK